MTRASNNQGRAFEFACLNILCEAVSEMRLVMHRRLAKSLDFGKKWYGVPCSQEYWDEVKPVFEFLEAEKDKGVLFCDLQSKENQVYVPFLNAFIREFTKQVLANRDVPKVMVKYLLGKYDCRKVSANSKWQGATQSFDIFSVPGNQRELIMLPSAKFPDTLLYIGLDPNSSNSVVMCFDNGWQFSFSVRETDYAVEFSLKVEGMPPVWL